MINVFLIPSWYPSQNNPLAGIFTKEQSLFISESGDVNFIISVAEGYLLSPKKPWESLKNLFAFLKTDEQNIRINNYYLEQRQPVLKWTNRIFNGNFHEIFKSHEKNLTNALRENKIDLIHAHVSYPAGYIAYMLSKKYNIPYIITEHMSPFPFKGYLHKGQPIQQICTAINNANKVVAVSESLKDEIVRYGLKTPIVIPNFIDENGYRLVSDNNSARFAFLTVGSLVKQKGIDILIKAVAKLKDELPLEKIEFKVIGSGSEYKKYKRLLKKYNLNSIVKLMGSMDRDKTRKEFENCNAFVLPSRHESFGVVYIEAMACGKPVIATRCGGPEMIVRSNQLGLLIEKEDIDELANSIKYIYNNADKYDLKYIRQFFLDNFSKKVNVKKYIELYKDVADVRY